MLYWPVWNDLEVLYRKAGYALSETVRLQLLLCAHDIPARNLLALIGALGKDRAALRRWLQAFRSILDGLQTYRAAPFRQLPKLASQLKSLSAASDRDLPGLLHQRFADPDNVPDLLSAVWQAALDSKLVRTRRTPRGTVIDVKRGRHWLDQGTSDTAWVRALAADPIIFRRLLRLALQKQHKPKRFDLLRRLRDLRRQPTYLRLRNLVRDAREHDGNGQDVLGSAFAWAGMENGIFPQGLPVDWVGQLADKPGHIRRLVDGACCCISRGLVGSGRRSDAARERYADHVAAAWKQATGKSITYTKETDTSRSGMRGQAYGPGLEFMLYSLRLLDAAATHSEAKRQIDRVRGWA